MDCIDCHNRPTHPFAGSAERALDRAIGFGEIPKTLPFVRREAVALVGAAYAEPGGGGRRRSARRLAQFYGQGYPEIYRTRRSEVDRAIRAVQRVYRRNVFPSMRVTWGTHPNNIGHADSPGCFRCHDDTHKATDGSAIRQDCDLCHTMPSEGRGGGDTGPRAPVTSSLPGVAESLTAVVVLHHARRASILDAAGRAHSSRHTEPRQQPRLKHEPHDETADQPEDAPSGSLQRRKRAAETCSAPAATGTSAGLPTTLIAPTGASAATTLVPGVVCTR